MISISDYPDLKRKLKSITGISSTLPIEVLYAAGRTVVDLNNIFITSKDRSGVSKSSDYVPRTVCSWTRGILESAIALKIPECVIVTEGDCAHTIPIMEVLEANGVKPVPFEFPIGREKKRLKAEIARLMNYYGVSEEECAAVKEKFDITRKLLKEIDELTYKDLKVGGFENHLYLVTASDFSSHPDKFHENVKLFLREARSRRPGKLSLRVGYAGIPPIFTDLHDFIGALGSGVIYNETARQFSMIEGAGMDMVDAYHQYTYPYTFGERLRDIKIAIKERELDCLIHYVQSFCFHQIEDRILKDELGDFPVLTIEGDHPAPLGGNEKLKIESFFASVENRKRPVSKSRRRKNFEHGRHCAGIDIGSRSVKIFFSNEGEPSFKIFDTMDFILKYMGEDGALKFATEVLGIESSKVSDVKYFSTGYGRYKAKIFDAEPYSEIQCHAAGAVRTTGFSDFTLLDIGGQDMKVMEIGDGEIKGFSMNDKCAAGSGRYLENMAGILKVPLEKLSQCHRDPVALSITCATFGETEVICKLMEGVEIERILAGVNYTVYARVEPMLKEHRSPSGILVVTSGIARNAAFIEILKKEAGFKKIIIPDHPQWMGAVGACILGFSGTD